MSTLLVCVQNLRGVGAALNRRANKHHTCIAGTA
jgi:hypothetical protein